MDEFLEVLILSFIYLLSLFIVLVLAGLPVILMLKLHSIWWLLIGLLSLPLAGAIFSTLIDEF